jgi:hypothetical protein
MRRRVSIIAAFVLVAAGLGIYAAEAAAPPVVTGTSPTSATNLSATTLSVQGQNFDPAGVTVSLEKGSTIVTGSGGTVPDSSHVNGVQFDLVGASPGFWRVRVKNNADGQSGTFGDPSDTSTSGFQVVGGQPTISSLSPTSIPAGAATVVTVKGTNLAKGIKVTSPLVDHDQVVNNPNNDVTADTVVWESLTQMHFTAHAPAAAAGGSEDITVTNTDGKSATKANALTVGAASNVTPPTVTSISPTNSTNNGPVTATVSGSNFHVGKIAVQLEKTGQTPIVMSNPVVTAAPAVPPGGSDTVKGNFDLNLAAPGKWTVRVTNTDDHGTAALADAFTVAASAPTVTAVSPSTGNQGDAVGVTISGTNFAKGAAVTLAPPDKITVTNVNVLNSSTLTGVINVCSGAAAGDHDVTVTNTDNQAGTKTAGFKVSAIRPSTYSYQAYDDGFLGGASVAAGDIVPGCGGEIVTGAGPGGGPHVIVAKPNQAGSGARVIASWFAYDPAFHGGVRVAVGEFDGDTTDGKEVVTAPGPGGGPDVRVWKVGADGSVAMIGEFFAYSDAFHGGVYVGAGDLDNSPANGDEIVTGAGPGGGPHVRVFTISGKTITGNAGFFAYNPAFAGGVSVAVGNFGPLQHLVVTGAGPGGGPDVETFTGSGGRVGGFFAYNPAFAGGVSVAAGKVVGTSGADDIVTGPGPGGGPDVQTWSGGFNANKGFPAYGGGFPGGVNVAVADADGDGMGEIVTTPWSLGPVVVQGNRLP